MKNRRTGNHTPLTERVTDVFLCVLSVVFVLYTGTNGYAAITPAKWNCFAVTGGLYAALTVLAAVQTALIGEKRKENVKRHIPFHVIFAVLYVLFVGVSSLLSLDRGLALYAGGRMDGLLAAGLYMLCMILVGEYGRARERYLHLLGASVTVCCLVACLQLLGGNPFCLYPEGMTYHDAFVRYAGAFLGTVGNVDMLAALLCTVCPMFLLFAIRGRKTRRVWLAIPALLGVGVLFCAHAAAGIIGCVGALILVGLIAKSDAREKTRRNVYVLTAVCAAASLAAVYFAGDKLGGTVGELQSLLHGNIDDSFGSGRIYIWRHTLSLLPDRLLVGGGPGTLEARLGLSFTRVDDMGRTVRSVIDTAHNEYLNILVNEGLLALLAYGGTVVCAVRECLKKAKRNGEGWRLCLLGGIFAYLIQALFSIRSPSASPLFFCLLGAAVGGRANTKEQE